MDVDQVAAAGNALKQRAADIDTLVTKIDGIVRSMPGVWDGPDAQQFVDEWWPEHKKTLVAASSHVAGLGQSALNNASEQREVSGMNGGGTHHPQLTPHVDPSPVPGGTPGATPNGPLMPPPTQEAFNSRQGGYGDLSPGGENDGQCTSWVAFRRDQLGLPPAPHGRGLDGEQWAQNMPTQLEAPVAGAVGSSPNHTFIVEAVRSGPPTTIEISEMNNSYLGGTGKVNTDTYTYEPTTGLWKSPNQRAALPMNFGN
jgi:hypothetical protein